MEILTCCRISLNFGALDCPLFDMTEVIGLQQNLQGMSVFENFKDAENCTGSFCLYGWFSPITSSSSFENTFKLKKTLITNWIA